MTGSADAGFTLLELLACLIIMSLVTALAAPVLSRFSSGATFRGTSRDLAEALRKTRDQAIQQGSAADFTIDLATGKFRAGAGPVESVPAGVSLRLVRTTEERISPRAGAIRFFADGSSTGGDLSLQQDSRHQDLLVDWVTGRVAIGTPE